MSEVVLLNYYSRYKSGNSNVIPMAWDSIKPATKFFHLFDSSGCLTKDDFNLAGMIGCKNGLDTFNIDGGSKISSWLIQLSNQSMLRELRNIPMYKVEGQRRAKTIPLSRLDRSSEDDLKDSNYIDFVFSKVCSSYEPSFISEEYSKAIIEEVLLRIYNINRAIYKFLKFKLDNPEVNGPTCARKLYLNQTSYNKYLRIIEQIIGDVIKEL